VFRLAGLFGLAMLLPRHSLEEPVGRGYPPPNV